MTKEINTRLKLLFSFPYTCAVELVKLLISQIYMTFDLNGIYSLKYKSFTTSGCKDIRIEIRLLSSFTES